MSTIANNRSYNYDVKYTTRSTDRRQAKGERRRSGNKKIWLLVCLWFLMMLGGGGLLMYFQNGPQIAAETPEQWPQTSGLMRQADLPSVILFANPNSPCTTDTLAQLKEAIEGERVKASIVFWAPEHADEEWLNSNNLNQAKQISGATIVFDSQGQEFANFGIQSSGQVIVYDPNGHLVYNGDVMGSGSVFQLAGSTSQSSRGRNLSYSRVPASRDSRGANAMIE